MGGVKDEPIIKIKKEGVKLSVRKDMRNESKMEFYKNADRIREQVTNWLLTDFGKRKLKRSINHIIKDISQKDQETIDNIFVKYNIQSKYTFTSEYDDWYIDRERNEILKILRNMSSNIIHANSIYAVNLDEYNERRMYQNKAIGDCYDLMHELQNIANHITFNINTLSPIIESVDKEIKLLKGWRQSDNKNRKKLKNEIENNDKEKLTLLAKEIVEKLK